MGMVMVVKVSAVVAVVTDHGESPVPKRNDGLTVDEEAITEESVAGLAVLIVVVPLGTVIGKAEHDDDGYDEVRRYCSQ